MDEGQMVEQAFQHLVDTYLATKHRKKTELITKAFNFARMAHKGVRRLSGEPYIMHPIAVAQIVAEEIGLGSTSICAALLHDVVEDTEYTVEDIANMFGEKIAQIVDGLTKISGGVFGGHNSQQAENFKKLLLTMNDDIRVILIKIADRLHNMRTLGSQPVNKRYKISGETLYIYAPLAHRLGLNAIKSELENLSFRYEHPEEYDTIVEKLKATEAERNTVFEEFTAPLRRELDARGLRYTIKARIKTPYSIWRKMDQKKVGFEEVYDILAVRIIFESKSGGDELAECFDIYSALTKIYPSHPGRIRDWVSRPKANGYQALHCTLMSSRGEWIEVQIRSQKMDDIAEKGFAAHWKYKEGNGENYKNDELDKWLLTIKEILDDPQPDAMDLLGIIKLNLYASEIFVFTPKGDVKTMPAGSTALDFAFSIHSMVGTHCMGVKVNHRLVPLSYQLAAGDQVEVLTSKEVKTDREWLNIVTTAKAKTKIIAALRRENRELRDKGEEMLGKFLEDNDLQKDTMMVERLVRLHHSGKAEYLYAAIGRGEIVLGQQDVSAAKGNKGSRVQGFRNLLSFGRSKASESQDADAQEPQETKQGRHDLVITEDNIDSVVLESCCGPIPGDKIMGFSDDKGVVHIHKVKCKEAEQMKAGVGNRIVAAEWGNVQSRTFLVSIYIRGLDKVGLLNSITEVIYKLMSVNMRKLDIESNDGIIESHIQLYVHNTEEVKAIIKNLKKIPDVKVVVRS